MNSLSVIIYFIVFQYALTGADIAFKKPVTASSIYDTNHRPEYLTNGQSCKDGNYPAASTKEKEDKPWFRVNLQRKFYIRRLVVTPRIGE